jgi:hypothetical protein
MKMGTIASPWRYDLALIDAKTYPRPRSDRQLPFAQVPLLHHRSP